MKVLFLTPRVPYPLDAGTSLRNFRLLQSAAREHDVHLLSFSDRPLRVEHLEVLQSICRRVELRPVPPHPAYRRLVRTLTAPLPDMAYRRWSDGFAETLRTMLAQERYDIVQIEGIEMARYLPLARGARRVFSEHNVEYLLQQRAYLVDRTHPARLPKALYSLLQVRKLARFEATACRMADRTLTVSEDDAVSLGQLEPRGEYRVVPNAIDPSRYPRRTGWPAQPAVLFTGTLDYRPNADAVRWLLDSIMPLVWREAPETRALIVGRGPSPDLVARGQQDSRIAVTGSVESIDPYWGRATVYVLPVRGGGGTRFKALEAMAAGLPLASTSMGMEGIDAVEGTHYLSGDTPAGLASAMVRLLGDVALREQLTTAADRLVRERYDWQAVAARLLATYRELA
ncbi:MAG: glycosyltransferase [Chloroflexi bacterium]|nr:glycosyltransferase [Chloroflexota bacterium]